MSEKIIIKRQDESIKIFDIIHDCWFDLNDITYNQDPSELIIKFEKEIVEKCISDSRKKCFLKMHKNPIVECFLEFHDVINYELMDDEKIGRYDFNTLEFDDEKKVIRVLTGVPLDFLIEVNNFKITVEITDKVVRHKKHLIW